MHQQERDRFQINDRRYTDERYRVVPRMIVARMSCENIGDGKMSAQL